MPLRLLILTTSTLLIIFGMHFFLFKSIIHFFHITKPLSRVTIYALTIVLTGIVISGFIFARQSGAWWVNGYYLFAATWTGFLIHLIVAAVLVWMMIFLVHIIKLPIGRSTIATLFLLAACTYSIYGIFTAFSPRIREIPVHFEKVPPAWENSKIIHLSDIHLGRIHGKRFTERLVRQVNQHEPDIIVITGDILDGLGGNHGELIKILDNLKAERGVFFVSGNHEGYIGKARTLQLLKQTTMIRLDNQFVEMDGLELVGVSYPGIQTPSEIDNLPEGSRKDGNVRILLFHTPTSIVSSGGDRVDRHFTTYWMPNTSFAANKYIHADLQLSGHTHHGQLFPFNIVTRLLYKGFDYGLNKSGDLYVYTTSGAGTWGPPMRTATISEIALIRLQKTQEE